jgi:hypothetical protein
LIVNIVVLVPILVLMIIKSPLVDHAWGSFTASRGILMSIYFAILVASVVLLIMPVAAFIAALLSVQVIYKVTTPVTVRSLKNPVVISNLVIATLHIFTVVSIFNSVGRQFTPIS